MLFSSLYRAECDADIFLRADTLCLSSSNNSKVSFAKTDVFFGVKLGDLQSLYREFLLFLLSLHEFFCYNEEI